MNLPKHIPQLDVLRGVAVLTVMLYHISDLVPHIQLWRLFHAGYVGVDLFFVLSGFLITRILLNTKDKAGYFGNFYARRALRILPPYYALLLVTFVLLPIIQPQWRASIFGPSHPWQAFPLFLQNLMVGRAPFDTLRVTWSLAIEEQFYLVWPILIWLAPRRSLKPLAVCVLLFSLGLRWCVAMGLAPSVDIYTNTLARLDGLGIGAFLAMWIPECKDQIVKWTGVGLITCVLPVTVAVAWFHPGGHWTFHWLVSICFAALLCVAINMPQLKNLEFLKYTGKISYALYLLHVPLFDLATSPSGRRFVALHSPLLNDIVLFVVSFGLCYALAALSWHFFESKFLQLKSRFEFSTAQSATATADLPAISID